LTTGCLTTVVYWPTAFTVNCYFVYAQDTFNIGTVKP